MMTSDDLGSPGMSRDNQGFLEITGITRDDWDD